jgi:cellobiose phosphorylase
MSIIQTTDGTPLQKLLLEKVRRYWDETLTAVQVQTPDAATNILANGWLNYQTLASRIREGAVFISRGVHWVQGPTSGCFIIVTFKTRFSEGANSPVRVTTI